MTLDQSRTVPKHTEKATLGSGWLRVGPSHCSPGFLVSSVDTSLRSAWPLRVRERSSRPSGRSRSPARCETRLAAPPLAEGHVATAGDFEQRELGTGSARRQSHPMRRSQWSNDITFPSHVSESRYLVGTPRDQTHCLPWQQWQSCPPHLPAPRPPTTSPTRQASYTLQTQALLFRVWGLSWTDPGSLEPHLQVGPTGLSPK